MLFRGARATNALTWACRLGRTSNWLCFVKSNSLELEGVLDSVEEGLVDSRLIQKEHVLADKAVSEENSSVSTMAQSSKAIRFVNHTSIVKDDCVEEERSLLEGMLSKRESSSDKNLGVLHACLHSLVSVSIVLARCFEHILLIQVIANTGLTKADNRNLVSNHFKLV